MNWDEYFLNICDAVALKSKDPITKIGCVIIGVDKNIISTGYNGFPSGANESESLWERPYKYDRVSHAESNSIALAAKHGSSTRGSTLYCSAHPCNDCAKLIIQAGIKSVKYLGSHPLNERSGFAYSKQISEDLFKECGVELIKL